jgi:hypothetical protein
MAASLSVRVQFGTSPGTQSAGVSGVDFISADNATNTLANRTANPLSIPAAGSVWSFEKWLKLRVDVAPANGVTNFKAWSAQGGAGGAGTGVTINAEGAVVTYVTPVTTQRGTASAIPTTQGAGVTWDSAALVNVGDLSKYLVLQLKVDSTAAAGNVTQATLSYSYDET